MEAAEEKEYYPLSSAHAGFLNELKQDTLAVYENQSYPFGDLLEKVVKKKILDRNPLFDVMLVYRRPFVCEC